MSTPTPMVSCACGCGQFRPARDNGRSRRYIYGHHSSRPTTHWRTCRARARRIEGAGVCRLEEIGGCSGAIEVHHKDKDFTNNNRSNLMSVCHSHHRLLDSGRIDPSVPVMPTFYVGTDGKRRYAHTLAKKVTLPRWLCSCGEKRRSLKCRTCGQTKP